MAREYIPEGWFRFYGHSFPLLNSGMKEVELIKNITVNVES